MQTLKLTKKYEIYPEYKDSGVEWLGIIPTSWDSDKLAHNLSRNDGGVWGEDDPTETGHYVLRSTEIQQDGSWNLESAMTRKLTDSDYKKGKLISGDLLVTKSSGSFDHLGKTALVTGEIEAKGVAYSNFMQRLRVNNNYLPKYLFYLLNNKTGRDQIGYWSSTTSGLVNLNRSIIGRFIFAIPRIEEQQKIATYLDKKTFLIDKTISKKQKLIELMKEGIVSLAQNEQENGTGELINMSSLVNLYSDIIKIDDYSEYITLGLYNRGRGLFHKDALLGKDLGESEFSKVNPGDLIISGQFAWEGAVALASENESDCVVSHRYHLLRNGVINTEYLLALLMTRFGDHILNESSRGSAGRNRPLNINILLKEKVRIPAKDVEEKIRSLLIKMRLVENLIKKSVTLLEEYKSSLISNVVTGKVKI